MPLKKLSINEKQIEKLRELVSNGVPIYIIAIKIKVSRATLWRNIELLGDLEYKYKKKCQQKEEEEKELFDWKDIKKHYKY